MTTRVRPWMQALLALRLRRSGATRRDATRAALSRDAVMEACQDGRGESRPADTRLLERLSGHMRLFGLPDVD